MKIQTKKELLDTLARHHSVLQNYGVIRYGIFGSAVRDEIDSDSDVDLLVEFFPGKKNFINFSELGFFLEELLERPVDLLTPSSLSPHLGPAILEEVEYVPINS